MARYGSTEALGEIPGLLGRLAQSGLSTRTQLAGDVSNFLGSVNHMRDTSEIASEISMSNLTTIFKFIADNMIDSNPGLTNVLKESLKRLLVLKSKVYPNESVEIWVLHILQQPPRSKAIYHIMEPLGKHVPGPYVWGLTEQFYISAFALFKTLQYANPVGKTLAVLLRYRGPETHVENDPAELEWMQTWLPYAENALLDEESRENILIYFVPLILRQRPTILKQFLDRIDPQVHRIGLLKAAQDAGIEVSEYLDETLLEALYQSHLPYKFEVLAMLLSTRQVSKPIPRQIYAVLTDCIDSVLCEANAKFRNQVFGVVRQFVHRTRASAYAAAKQAKDKARNVAGGDVSVSTVALDNTVAEAREFVQWFAAYVKKLLRPGCPYRCLVTGCQYIELLVVCGVDHRVDPGHFEKMPVPFPFSIDIYDSNLVLDLINLVPNDYEDIRSTAARLISMAPRPVSFLENDAATAILASRADTLLSGVRGRQGDGGARVAELVFNSGSAEFRNEYVSSIIGKVLVNIKMAKTDTKIASNTSGIHGYLQALALITESMDKQALTSQYSAQALECVTSVWAAVQDVLTNSAPEGNVPMPLDADPQDADELEGRFGAVGQVVLSYSWRALKESVNLAEILIKKRTLSNSELVVLGKILVEELTSIRHRGAYSSVAPALRACCIACYEVPELAELPLQWLHAGLDQILIETKLITRRSAGLPLLINSILVAHPKPIDPAVDRVMDKLFEIARLPLPDTAKETKLDLPQVHAYNCIRGALGEADLSRATARHVEPSLLLAISAFDSPIWSIRNCGFMLFSTLHKRLFGISRGPMSASVFFSRFKSLRQALLDRVSQKHAHLTAATLEALYPVLELLHKVKPVGGYDGLDDFVPHILELMASPYWKIRELSAQVLVNITLPSQTTALVETLVHMATTKRQNQLHGLLLALNGLSLPANFKLSGLDEKAFEIYDSNPCFETKIEAAKFIGRQTGWADLAWPPQLDSLNPALGKLRGMLVQGTLAEVGGSAIEFLDSPQKEVVEAALISLSGSAKEAEDGKIGSVLLKLLSHKDAGIRLQALQALTVSLEHPRYVVVDSTPFDVIMGLVQGDESDSVKLLALEWLGRVAASGTNQEHSQWISAVGEFGSESEPLSSRRAALASIKRFEHRSRSESLPSGSQIIRDRINHQLYMFVTDDEEVVRTAAANIADPELRDGAPAYCEARIVQRISPDYLYQWLVGPPLRLQLEEVRDVDESLFVVEKPNLYRDELRQVDLIAAALGPHSALSWTVPDDFETVRQEIGQVSEPLTPSSAPAVVLLRSRLKSIANLAKP